MAVDYWMLLQNLCIPFSCFVKGMVTMLNWKHKLILAPSESLHQWEKKDFLFSCLVHDTWYPGFISSFPDADSGIVWVWMKNLSKLWLKLYFWVIIRLFENDKGLNLRFLQSVR